MRNIYVLPTDKPSRLYINSNKNLVVTKLDYGYPPCRNVNIYITSDEEIKEGDYFIGFAVTNKKPYISCASEYKERKEEKGKIILTTDIELIKNGVQPIPDKFLEWFVKNTSCEEVEWDKNYNRGNGKYYYKILIPKEELKQEKLKEESLSQKIKFELGLLAMDYQNGVHTSTKVFYNVLKKLLFEAEKQEQDKKEFSEEEMKNRMQIVFELTNKGYSINEIFEQFKNK